MNLKPPQQGVRARVRLDSALSRWVARKCDSMNDSEKGLESSLIDVRGFVVVSRPCRKKTNSSGRNVVSPGIPGYIMGAKNISNEVVLL